MIRPGGLERHVLVGPPHRPVDLPGQLPGHVRDRRRPHDRAAGADIGDVGGAVVESGHGGVVPPAGRAVRPERVVRPALALALALVVGVGAPGPVPGQDRADLGAAPHGQHDLRRVGAGGIHLGLADLGDADPETLQRVAQGRLEVGGEVLVLAARVGHAGQRAADVLGEPARVPGRNPAQPVVVVPGQDVPARRAITADLVGDQVRGHELAQVPQMHRPGRADSRRAGRDLAGMPAFSRRLHLGRRAHHPVLGRSHRPASSTVVRRPQGTRSHLVPGRPAGRANSPGRRSALPVRRPLRREEVFPPIRGHAWGPGRTTGNPPGDLVPVTGIWHSPWPYGSKREECDIRPEISLGPENDRAPVTPGRRESKGG